MALRAVALISNSDVALFASLILLVFLLLMGVFVFGIWMSRRHTTLSIYSGLPLRRGSELSFSSTEKVLRFLFTRHQYDNRIFDLKRAAVCRETGRIFPNAVTWFDTIKVDWTFLQKRYPGKYVSWGSLTQEQQEIIRAAHDDDLKGYQTAFSSPNPSPKKIEPQYALAKPGPLYVDIETNVLLGWQCVPDTELEVLIVQKPVQITTISVT